MPRGGETLAYLVGLDGEEIIYEGGFVARFRVARSLLRRKGRMEISYSLTFHAADGRWATTTPIGFLPRQQIYSIATRVRSLAP